MIVTRQCLQQNKIKSEKKKIAFQVRQYMQVQVGLLRIINVRFSSFVRKPLDKYNHNREKK